MSTSRKEKNEQVVAARVEAIMADTRFAGLRTRPARVALAITMIALIVIIPFAWVLFGAIPGIIAVLAGAAGWWLLRMSVRLVADLPEEYLDERQSALRNRLYVDAYRWFGGLVVLLASAGLLAFIVLALRERELPR